jgi:hypothetical protein
MSCDLLKILVNWFGSICSSLFLRWWGYVTLNEIYEGDDVMSLQVSGRKLLSPIMLSCAVQCSFHATGAHTTITRLDIYSATDFLTVRDLAVSNNPAQEKWGFYEVC